MLLLLLLNCFRCDTIKQEYDRILSVKTAELREVQANLDELQIELNKTKETSRLNLERKDLELKTLTANHENLKYQLTSAESEIKQMKTRLDVLRTKDKEEKLQADSTITKLENENEKLSARCDCQEKEIGQWQTKYEAIKCQLNKYEQLIDNLNEQIILLKRESKEAQMNLEHVSKSYEIEKEIKSKLETKAKILDEQLNEKIEQLTRYSECERTNDNLQLNLKQMQHSLSTK